MGEVKGEIWKFSSLIKGDFDKNEDVDGADLDHDIDEPGDIGLGDFAQNFGEAGPFERVSAAGPSIWIGKLGGD